MICDECETVAHCMKNGCVPKTTKQTEAMKLALEALSASDDFLFNYHDCEPNNEREVDAYSEVRGNNMEAWEAIREALAEQPAPVQQEPVAWRLWDEDPLGGTDHRWAYYDKSDFANGVDPTKHFKVEPLYTSPQPAQQEPVALPEGKKLILVDGSFDDLMYWLERCEDKGHLENCLDLVEPWENFSYEECTTPPAQHKPLHIGDESAEFKAWFDAWWVGDGEQGETIPTQSDKHFLTYMDQYTLGFGAWMAARHAAHNTKENT